MRLSRCSTDPYLPPASRLCSADLPSTDSDSPCAPRFALTRSMRARPPGRGHGRRGPRTGGVRGIADAALPREAALLQQTSHECQLNFHSSSSERASQSAGNTQRRRIAWSASKTKLRRPGCVFRSSSRSRTVHVRPRSSLRRRWRICGRSGVCISGSMLRSAGCVVRWAAASGVPRRTPRGPGRALAFVPKKGSSSAGHHARAAGSSILRHALDARHAHGPASRCRS